MTETSGAAGEPSAAAETRGNLYAIAQVFTSGRCAGKNNVAHGNKSRMKFYTTFGNIANRIYPVIQHFVADELPAELQKHQSLFPLSQKVQLRPASEVLSPALARDVPLTHPIPALTGRPQGATEFRRERAPLAGRWCRYHDESRAARAPRAR